MIRLEDKNPFCFCPSQARVTDYGTKRHNRNKIDPANLKSGQPLKSMRSLPNKHVLSFARSKNKGDSLKHNKGQSLTLAKRRVASTT